MGSLERRVGGVGSGGDCRVWAGAGDLWVRLAGLEGKDCGGVVGGFSHESENDLALMVSDFLENGSGGVEGRYSSDSDCGSSDLNQLADMILYYKQVVDQFESNLISVVHSLLLSINEHDLYIGGDGKCDASCLNRFLVKLLRLSGYDAAICTSKWLGAGKVPGGMSLKCTNYLATNIRFGILICFSVHSPGDHEYIDVVKIGNSVERFIIDIDFHSHFEIARAVKSYDAILNSLPVVYVGSQLRLKHYLRIMVDAAKCSLKQNSMPLPPWRSLPYLQAKWDSKYERKYNVGRQGIDGCSSDHKQCIGHLKRLKSTIQFETDAERLFKSIAVDKKRRAKSERLRPSLLRS